MSGLRPVLQRWWPWLIFVTTTIVFLPVLDCGFLNWDDQANFVRNYHYKGWSSEHLRWILTSFHLGVWQPMSWLLLDLEWTFWGLDPAPHHLVSLLLHSLNAVLVFFLGQRLLGSGFILHPALSGASPSLVPPKAGSFILSGSAAFGALFYAVHPLRVETVAWLSCQPYLLATMFSLLAIIAHLKAISVRAPFIALQSSALSPQSSVIPWRLAAIGFYALALMSKGIVITLPVALVILDFYPLRRLSIRFREWLRPEFRSVLIEKIPFFILAAVAAWLAAVGKSHGMRDWTEHGLIQRFAQMAFGAVFYVWKTVLPVGLSPLYPLPAHLNPFEARFVLSAMTILGITAILLLARRKWPSALMAWLIFGVLVSPVLGFAQAGPQIAADRYTYLPGIVWGIMAGGIIFNCGLRIADCGSTLLTTLSVGRMGGMKTEAWSFMLKTGAALLILAFAVLSWCGIEVWKSSETVWRRALEIGPPNVAAYNNLGNTLLDQGRLKESVEQYQKLLQLEPGHAEAYNNLGLAWAGMGQLDQAIGCYEEAIRLNPRYASAYNNLGAMLSDQKRTPEAVIVYQKAIALQPDNPDTRCNLGLTLMSLHKWNEAINALQAALKIDGRHHNALYGLAWLKATSPDPHFRNGGEALALAKRLCALTDDENPQSFDALAAVYAELGKFEEAQQAAIRGIEWATRLNQSKLADEIRQRLELYRKHTPYRIQ